MRNRNGNSLIQGLIMSGDFILLNIIVISTAMLLPDLSNKFDADMKMYIVIFNTSMIVAEFFFSPVIHLHHINFGKTVSRIFNLVVTQTVLSYVLIRTIYGNGGLFNAVIYHAPTLFIAIFMARAAERSLLNWYRQRGGNTRTIVFVGNDPANMLIYKDLMNSPSSGYKTIGYYSDNTFADCPPELKKLGSIADLRKMTSGEVKAAFHADEMFCSLSHTETELIHSIMRYCDHNMIRFFYVPRILGTIQLGLSSERVGNFNLFTNHTEPLADPTYRFLKRLFDIVVSAAVCVIMLPFIPVIALIIKIQSPGPVFFSQERTGFNGRSFKILKFRSMHVNSNADNIQATANDPRKFPFGDFMRKCNIDEFPQFFNVLCGDMSIVGPRPHMTYHTHLYSELIDKYMIRHFSKPGITGWAQITGFRGETKELWQMEERIKRDIWYIENWSFWLDIRIIFMTATSTLRKDENAY